MQNIRKALLVACTLILAGALIAIFLVSPSVPPTGETTEPTSSQNAAISNLSPGKGFSITPADGWEARPDDPQFGIPADTLVWDCPEDKAIGAEISFVRTEVTPDKTAYNLAAESFGQYENAPISCEAGIIQTYINGFDAAEYTIEFLTPDGATERHVFIRVDSLTESNIPCSYLHTIKCVAYPFDWDAVGSDYQSMIDSFAQAQ